MKRLVFLKHSKSARDGWENLDLCPKWGDSFPWAERGLPVTWTELPVDPGSVDELFADDVLHQVPQRRVLDALQNWRGALRAADSRATVDVMDFDWILRTIAGSPQHARWIEPDDTGAARGLVHLVVGHGACGFPCGEIRSHFDAEYLAAQMLRAGFVEIERVTAFDGAERRIRLTALRGAD